MYLLVHNACTVLSQLVPATHQKVVKLNRMEGTCKTKKPAMILLSASARSAPPVNPKVLPVSCWSVLAWLVWRLRCCRGGADRQLLTKIMAARWEIMDTTPPRGPAPDPRAPFIEILPPLDAVQYSIVVQTPLRNSHRELNNIAWEMARHGKRSCRGRQRERRGGGFLRWACEVNRVGAESRVARFGLFEAKKWQIWPFLYRLAWIFFRIY